MLCLPLCLINWTTSHALCSADEQAPSCVSAPQSSLLTFASYMAFGPTNLTPAPSSISRFVSIFADVQTSRRAKSSLQGKAAQSNSYLRIGNPNRLTNLPCQSFSTHTRTCQARLRVPHAAHVVYSCVGVEHTGLHHRRALCALLAWTFPGHVPGSGLPGAAHT